MNTATPTITFAADLAAAQAAYEANPYKHLDCYAQRALETRKRREAEYARARECKKAMKIYFIDQAAARQNKTQAQGVDAYVARDSNGHYVATEYAKSRFGELSKAKRKA